MSSLITPAMQAQLKGPTRTLCWLWWFEGTDSDLYAWSGAHSISWDGQTYIGVGGLFSMGTQQKPDALQHVDHTFVLSGLDPTPLAGLSDSVRGRRGEVWLGAIDAQSQIVKDPILLTEVVQDTLTFDRGADDTVTLTLTAFEALPFLGRVKGDKYSAELWLQDHSNDEGFYYNSLVALAGPAVNWQP